MTLTVERDTAEAEKSLAELTARAYETYVDAADALPLFLDDMEGEGVRYLSLLRRSGSTFAPTLARAARFCDDSLIAKDLESELPESLPRLVRLLEDGFVLFSSIESPDSLVELVSALPTVAEVSAVLDPSVIAWIKEHGGNFRAA
jgi:hypothetical protein